MSHIVHELEAQLVELVMNARHALKLPPIKGSHTRLTHHHLTGIEDSTLPDTSNMAEYTYNVPSLVVHRHSRVTASGMARMTVHGTDLPLEGKFEDTKYGALVVTGVRVTGVSLDGVPIDPQSDRLTIANMLEDDPLVKNDRLFDHAAAAYGDGHEPERVVAASWVQYQSSWCGPKHKAFAWKAVSSKKNANLLVLTYYSLLPNDFLLLESKAALVPEDTDDLVVYYTVDARGTAWFATSNPEALRDTAERTDMWTASDTLEPDDVLAVFDSLRDDDGVPVSIEINDKRTDYAVTWHTEEDAAHMFKLPISTKFVRQTASPVKKMRAALATHNQRQHQRSVLDVMVHAIPTSSGDSVLLGLTLDVDLRHPVL